MFVRKDDRWFAADFQFEISFDLYVVWYGKWLYENSREIFEFLWVEVIDHHVLFLIELILMFVHRARVEIDDEVFVNLRKEFPEWW